MKYTNNDIIFDSYDEARRYYYHYRSQGFTFYKCDRCGINFASQAPDTDTGGIICQICVSEVNEREF